MNGAWSKDWETLRFLGNKINCFPISVYYICIQGICRVVCSDWFLYLQDIGSYTMSRETRPRKCTVKFLQFFFIYLKTVNVQTPGDAYIIKQWISQHSILLNMVHSKLRAACLVSFELMYNSISWNNCWIGWDITRTTILMRLHLSPSYFYLNQLKHVVLNWVHRLADCCIRPAAAPHHSAPTA